MSLGDASDPKAMTDQLFALRRMVEKQQQKVTALEDALSTQVLACGSHQCFSYCSLYSCASINILSQPLYRATLLQQKHWQKERSDLQRTVHKQRDELDMANRQLSELHALSTHQQSLMKFGYVDLYPLRSCY